jgi:hypothetical protein
VPDEEDYGSPFFLSYARAGQDSARAGDADERVEKFFHDLEENVGELISPPAAVPVGFMDREIEGGMWWTDELMRAVGTCQVLVALLSVRYLRSDWCKMEWHAFTQRTVRPRAEPVISPTQGCIVPVYWAPVPSLPGHISLRQIFSPGRELNPGAPAQYKRNGIFGLMRTRDLANFYEIVVWELAMHIAKIYHSQRVEHRLFELAELRSAVEGDQYVC